MLKMSCSIEKDNAILVFVTALKVILHSYLITTIFYYIIRIVIDVTTHEYVIVTLSLRSPGKT